MLLGKEDESKNGIVVAEIAESPSIKFRKPGAGGIRVKVDQYLMTPLMRCYGAVSCRLLAALEVFGTDAQP